jgi:hypothetical protein
MTEDPDRSEIRIRRLSEEEATWYQLAYALEHFADDGTPPWPAAEDTTSGDKP